MPFERSDEARREDKLHERLGSLERTNRKQSEKIAEFERIIVEAKKCVKNDQETIGKLRVKLAQQKNDLTANKIRLTEILTQIDKLRTSYNDALEQIWNNLKMVKIHFC